MVTLPNLPTLDNPTSEDLRTVGRYLRSTPRRTASAADEVDLDDLLGELEAHLAEDIRRDHELLWTIAVARHTPSRDRKNQAVDQWLIRLDVLRRT